MKLFRVLVCTLVLCQSVPAHAEHAAQFLAAVRTSNITSFGSSFLRGRRVLPVPRETCRLLEYVMGN